MKRKFMAFILVAVAGSALLYSLKAARNDFFEYCTTKAYGLPLPWKIENCECDGRGGQTAYPAEHAAINVASVAIVAIFIGLVTPGRKRKTDPRKPG